MFPAIIMKNAKDKQTERNFIDGIKQIGLSCAQCRSISDKNGGRVERVL